MGKKILEVFTWTVLISFVVIILLKLLTTGFELSLKLLFENDIFLFFGLFSIVFFWLFTIKTIYERLVKAKKDSNYVLDVLDSQENIILVFNKKNKIVHANAAFFRFFHEFIDVADLNKNSFSLASYFIKEDGFVYDFEDKNWMDFLLENKKESHSIQIEKNSKINSFTISLNKSKKYKHTIISLSNTTELETNKLLLEEYKKVVDAGTIVSKTDLKGKITYVNEEFCKISGYSEDELIGKHHNILRSPNVAKEVFEDLWTKIKNKQIWMGDIENIRKDGSSYFVKATIIPILNSKGEISEYIALRHDITQEVIAKEQAQDAEKIKSQFLANMSHEIRTPLNAIMGFTNILGNSNLDEKQRKYINIIESSSNNLLSIVNDIFDLSELQSGKYSSKLLIFNPKKKLEVLKESFEEEAGEKNINFELDIDEEIPMEIKGDSLALKQVLSNMISNSIKFTSKEGNISIFLKLLNKNNKTCKIRFGVKDDGIGIEKQKQKEIFNAFSQVDSSLNRKYNGVGLGLSLSSKIIEALHSKIELESELGQGSCFYFDLEFEVILDINRLDESSDVVFPYDIEKSSSEIGIDVEMTKRIAANFARTVKDDLEALKESIAKEDFDNIYKIVNKIKGAALNLRMNYVTKFASEIEKLVTKKTLEKVDEEFINLEKAILSIERELR